MPLNLSAYFILEFIMFIYQSLREPNILKQLASSKVSICKEASLKIMLRYGPISAE